ncbi:hypothetical protein COOONC_28301 [Cooperia oncophora]
MPNKDIHPSEYTMTETTTANPPLDMLISTYISRGFSQDYHNIHLIQNHLNFIDSTYNLTRLISSNHKKTESLSHSVYIN